MKANHNSVFFYVAFINVVLNILKEQNESKSQHEVIINSNDTGCFKYPQRTK